MVYNHHQASKINPWAQCPGEKSPQIILYCGMDLGSRECQICVVDIELIIFRLSIYLNVENLRLCRWSCPEGYAVRIHTG